MPNYLDYPVYNHEDYRGSNYVHPLVPQVAQPLPPPFFRRDDSQRVIVGSQFDQSIPERSQGIVGTLLGPTHGGRWCYSDDVLIERIEFRVIGGDEIAPGRTGDSGFWVVRRGGSEQRVLDLSSTDTLAYGTESNFWLSDPLPLKQGEVLRLRTTGATKEMIAVVSVRSQRPFI